MLEPHFLATCTCHSVGALSPTMRRVCGLIRQHGVRMRTHETMAAFGACRLRESEECLVLSIDTESGALAALAELRCMCSVLPTVVVSEAEDVELAIPVVRSGGAFVCASMGDERVAEKVDRALGAIRVAADARRLLSRIRTGFAQMSPREREVFFIAAMGHEMSEVARRLGIRPRTAYIHRTNAMTKLGVGHNLELAAVAMELLRCCRTRDEASGLLARLGPIPAGLRMPIFGTGLEPRDP